MSISRSEGEIWAEVGGGSLFSGICSDPRQKYKRPMAIIRCWISEARRPVICHPISRPKWTRKLYYTAVGLTGGGVSGSGTVEKGGGLRPWGRMEPRPGEQMQGQESARVRASVEEGRSGQEEELPPDGPSSQQGHHASHQ